MHYLLHTFRRADYKLILDEIKEKVAKEKYYISFAHTEKLRRRKISTKDIEEAISNGDIVENYPLDLRGPSCLISGFNLKGKSLHIVCGKIEEKIIIVTVYEPSSDEWEDDLKTRRR